MTKGKSKTILQLMEIVGRETSNENEVRNSLQAINRILERDGKTFKDLPIVLISELLEYGNRCLVISHYDLMIQEEKRQKVLKDLRLKIAKQTKQINRLTPKVKEAIPAPETDTVV